MGRNSCPDSPPPTFTPTHPPTHQPAHPNHLARFCKSPAQALPIHLSVLAFFPSHYSSHPLPLGLPPPTATPSPQPNQPTQPTKPRQHPRMECGSPRNPNARSPLHPRVCPASQAELKTTPLQCKGLTVAVQRPVRCSAKDRPSHCKVGAKGVHSLQKVIMTGWPLQCKGLPFAVQSGSRRGPLQCKGLSIAVQKVACCSARCDLAGRCSGGRERRACPRPSACCPRPPTPRKLPVTPCPASPSAQRAYDL